MSPPPKAMADILAKFPGPIILHPSKVHLLHLLIVGIVFFISGIWLLKSGGHSGPDRAALMGCVVMGGLTTPVVALAFLPKAAFLRLDGAGFEYADCFYKRRFAWSDVKDFGVWTGPYGVRVAVSFKASWRSHFIIQFLPEPYGGFTVDETAALMNSWRNLAIPGGTQVTDHGKRLIAHAGRLGRNFAHVSIMQWIGMAVIGLSFVGAVIVFLAHAHAPQPGEPADPILSDHGPERIACDTKWSTLQQPDPRSYREFLQNCMEGKSGNR